MRIFWDSEFTGLHQHTTLISIGLIAENGRLFYAELDDYDRSQVNEWIQDNVISKLAIESGNEFGLPKSNNDPSVQLAQDVILLGFDRCDIAACLKRWFSSFDSVELWSDCLVYDWVLLSEMIADRSSGYPEFPDNFTYHSPFDIWTLFKIKGIDPDINKEEFSGLVDDGNAKHLAIWDAKVIKACYEKLMKL